jgi:creatinine amidohydrolase
VTGAPSRGSAVQGADLVGWMVEDLSALVERGMHENPPLDHSYFAKDTNNNSPETSV